MLVILTILITSVSSVLFTNEFDSSNGTLPDELRLSDVHFVGAHNSHVNKPDHWIFHHQKMGLEKQWKKHGVRAFSIAMHYYNPSKSPIKGSLGFNRDDPYIALCYDKDPAQSNCTLSLGMRYNFDPRPALDYLIELRELLEENPEEVAILIIRSGLGTFSQVNGMKERKELRAEMTESLIEESGLKPLIYHLGKRPWPTMGELRELDKRLIIFSTSREDPFDHISLFKSSITKKLSKEFLEEEEVEYFQKVVKAGLPKNRFYLLNHYVKIPVTESSWMSMLVNYTPIRLLKRFDDSVGGTDYNKLNRYELIKDRVERTQKIYKTTPNIILMDYVHLGEEGGAQKIVQELNLEEVDKLE